MTRILLALLSIGLAFGAGVFGVREYRAFLQLDAGQDAVMVGLVQDPDGFRLVRAPSLRSQRTQMLTCVDWQSNSLHARHAAPTRESFARACAARAAQILDAAPTLSVAHLGRAYSEWNLGNLAATLAALDRARATGAAQGWLAARRLRLVLQIAAGRDTPKTTRTAVLAAARADLLVLADGPQGLDNLARLYLSFPMMQDWIVAELEQIDPRDQRQFLANVRRLSRDGAT